ncbi:MAG: GxxExxY protein [Crocinitomicaceae bacterium]|nr:GxxExxY protein [Crocinitomicaceae bacterium]
MNYNNVTDEVISKSIKVHRKLGPGLLESAYRECLFYELQKSGFNVKKEVPLPLVYEDVKLDHGYRIDLLVEDKIVLELKTVDQLNEVHQAQILTYLKLGEFPIGYLLNFNVKMLKDGIKRYRI